MKTQLSHSRLTDIVAVGLISAAMLAFELTLTRLFAVAQFYHFAFMVISLALLGSGAAGSLLSIWPRLKSLSAWWALGFSLAALVSYLILNLIPFDSYAIAWEPRQILYLILTLVGATAPFLFSGLLVGGLLAKDTAGLHRIYAANLTGSALGALLVLPLLDWLGAIGALFLSAGLGLTAALLFPAPFQRQATNRDFNLVVVIGALACGLLAFFQPTWTAIHLSPYKTLTQVMRAPDAHHIYSGWDMATRVDVVESDSIHLLPGLSQNALLANPPPQVGLTLDGDNLQPITRLSPEDDLAHTLAEYVPVAAIGALRPEAQHVLALEPGGGWDVLMMLVQDTPSVTVVERNRQVIDLLEAEGLYADPSVEVVWSEARIYASRAGQRFDVVVLSLSDSFHPVTSGAYSLGEDYRYTVEAIDADLNLLAPGGILLVTRWLQTPPTESLRMLATIEAALQQQGVETPADHLAAFRSLRTMTFIISPEPLSVGEQAVIGDFTQTRAYDLVWLPSIRPDEVNRYQRLPEATYYQAFVALLNDPSSFVRDHEFDIRPPRDDRPFFYHYFRWRQTPDVLAELGRSWQPFGGSGYFVLVALLMLVSVLAAVSIVGPLLLGRLPSPVDSREDTHLGRGLRVRTLLFFLMLGLAFLLIEIPLAQRFILFLGQPVIAFSVVLFAILLASGLGSLSAPRWDLRRALPLLVAAVVLTALLTEGLFQVALGWALPVRMTVAVLALFPVGFLMGVPFVRGLSIIEAQAPGLTPWAWAINGSASVISGVLAVMAALGWGFTVVLWLGAGAYALAALAIWPLTSNHPRT